MLGKKINGFELIRLLGVGGMAEVWYAENEIHKPAAVKVLNPELSRNASIVERFRNEAEIMVRLDHHNIRQVYGYGLIDERPAIVMEYLNGADLAARMNQGQRFTNEELVKWWNQLVDALQYTHEEGIVHRDIKPANIFVDNRGNIKLLDFGIAKIRESISLTHTGTFMGTLLYMSPEQIKDSKHIDYHTDIYSLAVTFVHLLTGQKPYDETTTSNFDIQLSIVTKPLDLSGVPEQWRAFLEPYLNKEAEQRPDLRFFNATQPVTLVSPKPTTPNRPAETPVSAGKTTINEKPYNIDEIHKENEPKKTFLGFSKKEGWFWLGLFVVYELLTILNGAQYRYTGNNRWMIWTFSWFIQACASLALFIWLIRILDRKTRNCGKILPYIVSGLCVIVSVLWICDVNLRDIMLDGTLFFILVLLALAILFVYRPEKFKALPYIVLTLTIAWWGVMTDLFRHFRGWLLLDNIDYYTEVWKWWENYSWYYDSDGLGYYYTPWKYDIKIGPYIDMPLFILLPALSLLVVAIVRSVKAKKATKTAIKQGEL